MVSAECTLGQRVRESFTEELMNPFWALTDFPRRSEGGKAAGSKALQEEIAWQVENQCR